MVSVANTVEAAAVGRLCTICRQEKAAVEFDRNRMGRGGLHSQCKVCRRQKARDAWLADPVRRARTRQNQQQNPKVRRLANGRSRQTLRFDVLSAYGGTTPRCACCGEAYMGFLTIDHIAGGGRQHKREIGSKLYTWLRSRGYPAGFRVLCFNCNCALGIYGKCPHSDQTIGVCVRSPRAWARPRIARDLA